MNLSLTLSKRLVFFGCVTLLCYVITSFIVGFMTLKGGADARWLRIAAVVQDIVLFILPAIVTALFCTRLPARFLTIDRFPRLRMSVMALCTLVVSIPAMNLLIQFNESISLPSALSGVEEYMRQAEAAARSYTETLLSGDSVMSLIVSLLIVGVLAGFSEELFFRGAFQRLLVTGRVNVHVAVWIVAVVFSAMHMQFYGFFPRMLLGAYFGYLAVWSGSLWLPVIIHAFNNCVYIVGQWHAAGAQPSAVDTVGTGGEVLMACSSVVLTALGISLIYRQRLR